MKSLGRGWLVLSIPTRALLCLPVPAEFYCCSVRPGVPVLCYIIQSSADTRYSVGLLWPCFAAFASQLLSLFQHWKRSARVPVGTFLAAVWGCSPAAQAVGSCSCPEPGARQESPFIHSFSHTWGWVYQSLETDLLQAQTKEIYTFSQPCAICVGE